MMEGGNFSPSPSPSKRPRVTQYNLASAPSSATSHAARDLLSGELSPVVQLDRDHGKETK
jgi:hypothetical protein